MADKVVVKIDGDNSGFKNAFGKVGSIATAGLSKFNSFSTGIAKGIGGAVSAAAAGIGGLTAKSVQSYADYEQLIGGVETLFKTSAREVENYANAAYKTAGLSANQYMETVTGFSASLLQSLGGDTKKAAGYADQAVIDMSDNANKMGSSMESIQVAYQGFAKQNYTMLDNLKLGYGGTKEEMQRLLEDAEKISGIKYDISSFADVTQAIHVMQTELGITGTTALEASTTIQGSAGAMAAAWNNVLTGMADDNQDFGALLDTLIDSVATFAENIIPRIQIALSGIGDLIVGLAPVIMEALPALISTLLPSLISSAQELITIFITEILNNKEVLIEGVRTTFTALVDGVREIMPMLQELAATIIPLIVEMIISGQGLIWELGITILTGLITGIAENLPMLMETAQQTLNALIASIQENLPILVQAAIDIVLALVNFLTENLPTLIPVAVNAVLTIIQGLLDNLPMLVEAAINLIVAIVQGMVSALPQIIAMVPQIIIAIVNTLIANIGNIISAAIEIIMALITGLIGAIPQLIAAIPQIILGIVTGLISNLDKIIMAAPQIIVALITGLINGIPNLIAAIPQLISAIVDTFMKTNWLEVGINIIKGILSGFLNLGSLIWDAVCNVGNQIIGGIKSFFGIASPAKKMKPLGKFIGQGAAVGLESSTGDFVDVIDDQEKAVENRYKKFDVAGMAINAFGAESDALPLLNSGVGSMHTTSVMQAQNVQVSSAPVNVTVESVVELDGREIARGISEPMGVQLAWEM